MPSRFQSRSARDDSVDTLTIATTLCVQCSIFNPGVAIEKNVHRANVTQRLYLHERFEVANGRAKIKCQKNEGRRLVLSLAFHLASYSYAIHHVHVSMSSLEA